MKIHTIKQITCTTWNFPLLQVIGSYAFVDPVGEEVSVKYEADHEGFRAESDHIPQVSVPCAGELVTVVSFTGVPGVGRL